jgi:hypothetical protein
MSQVFILSVPARLAAVWFGPNEVSSACSIGVFGNQVRLCATYLICFVRAACFADLVIVLLLVTATSRLRYLSSCIRHNSHDKATQGN